MDATMHQAERLHSAESAAALLSISPSTVRWWWTTGRLQRVKIGRLTRVRESELLTLIEQPISRTLPLREGVAR
jgi:excisionase family DNA binding protein